MSILFCNMGALQMAERLMGRLRNEVDLSAVVGSNDGRKMAQLNGNEKWQRLDSEKIAVVDRVAIVPSKYSYSKKLGLMLVPGYEGNVVPPRNIQNVDRSWGVSMLSHTNRAVREMVDDSDSIGQILYGANGGPFRSIREVLHLQLAGVDYAEWQNLQVEELEGFKQGTNGLITKNFLGREIATRVGTSIGETFCGLIDSGSMQVSNCGSVFLELDGPLEEEEDFCNDQLSLWQSADAQVRRSFEGFGIDPEYRCHAISFGQVKGERATMTIHAALAIGPTNGGVMESNRLVLSSKSEPLTAEENVRYFETGEKFAQMMS